MSHWIPSDNLCLHVRQYISDKAVKSVSIETELKEYLAALPDSIGNGNYTFTYQMPIDLSQPGNYYLDSYIAEMVNNERVGYSCVIINEFTITNPDITGIAEIVTGESAEAEWHDLNGRRLTAKPAAKGLYIVNGRKVVVK